MKIALAQMRMDESAEVNVQQSILAIEQAAKNKADMIFFPELQLYPFFPQYPGLEREQYALELEHAHIRRIMDACQSFHIMASPNVYLKEGGAYYDASLFISAEGELQGVSRMVHIMQCHHFYEQDYYTPSAEGFQVYDTPFGKVGIVICFDRHLPESVRTCAVLGADLILIPTANTIGEPMEMFEWELRVQAMHSSVFIAMCNRVGCENEMRFAGQSLVTDYKGELIAKAGGNEQILYAELDLEKSRAARSENPYFTLRRPQFYR